MGRFFDLGTKDLSLKIDLGYIDHHPRSNFVAIEGCFVVLETICTEINQMFSMS
jgi:hypothetical protein